jgi:hypothetical protein
MEMIEFQDWADNEIKTVDVTHGFGNAKYQLRLRQFIPKSGDVLEKTWLVGGMVKSHPCPPYAIENMHATAGALYKYINTGILNIIRAHVRESDQLFRNTFDFAVWWSRRAPVSTHFSTH